MAPERIRILHVFDNLGRGGLQNGLVNLVTRLNPQRFEHVICTTRFLEEEKAHRFSPEQARVMCIASRQGQARFQMGALARTIRELKPHIVHSRNWGGVEAVLAGRWVGRTSLVHSEHGLDPDGVAGEPWRRIAFRRIAFELAHRVVCVSGQLRELYAKRLGFSERRMTVIHNGVDTGRFAPDPKARAEQRRELGIGGDEFCIGCVGRLSPIKDYPTVLRAVGQLAGSAANWRLVVIGEGPERANLQAILDAHPEWKERVLFAGLSNRIPEMLNAMDVYVLSSLTEGISNSLLEAMATGLPALVTATGGNPEVVADGVSGMLFPVGDAAGLADRLLHLYAQPEERLRLGAQALTRMRDNFSLEAMISNYANLYEGLMTQPKVRLREVACL